MSQMLKNIWLLAGMQSLMMSGNTLMVTTSALVGFSLATDKSLATLPLAMQFLATMLVTIPASFVMKRHGRRMGFLLGTILGITGAMLLAVAIYQHSFWLFVLGASLIGMFNGFGVYYRFAAVDAADDDYKSRAISYVMAGGVIAALVGPNLANWTLEWSRLPFAGSYLALCGIYLLSILALPFLRIPQPTEVEQQAKGRPLRQIIRQPVFIVALLGAMLGYGVMSLVMTATPLAMKHSQISFSDTAMVIQWHVLGMFAPSFFTGHLIRYFGVLRIMLAGVLLYVVTVATNLNGTGLWDYWLALLLLGVGWNFLYVGGTTLLTESYRPEEKAKVQALNDFMIFTTVTLTSVSAGVLQYYFGWQVVNMGVMPILLIILVAILWLMMQRRKERRSIAVSS
ncbi:MAG: MFS transporter [Gammaproteobacteria bacterium]|nr:MFS transporter [Gammaproteobacteria bacterium]